MPSSRRADRLDLLPRCQGNLNLAPYSFFTGSLPPAIIGFSSTSWKDSVANIKETGEFVWNLATRIWRNR